MPVTARKKKLSIVGIQGLPNNYGGFETLSDYLVRYLHTDFDITVYCSGKDLPTRFPTYEGARLEYIEISSHGLAGMLYDTLSLMRAIKSADAVLFLGFGAGLAMPFIKKSNRSKIVLNIGGLDWKREKWSKTAQRVIRLAERLLVRYSGKLIADNKGIQDYFTATYGRDSVLIPYGGDQAERRALSPATLQEHPFLQRPYALGLARIQPDNNIALLLDAFAGGGPLPLVMIGNWKHSEYARALKARYSETPNVLLIDAIYDRVKLDEFRTNCTVYIHGHSAGGTNPALVEAMFLGLPVFAFASGYNEFTSHEKALYFRNGEELRKLTEETPQPVLDRIGKEMKAIADKEYRWREVAQNYRKLIAD